MIVKTSPRAHADDERRAQSHRHPEHDQHDRHRLHEADHERVDGFRDDLADCQEILRTSMPTGRTLSITRRNRASSACPSVTMLTRRSGSRWPPRSRAGR